ncbi:MAG: methyltransferase domain-containing protein [Planctomycetes bacterium]|nr:methyltransferase domain-containing protein [Planctomycetota bacterium]
MSSPVEEYALTTDAEELLRLGFQHRLWSSETQALWRRAGIVRGQRVLDLGCGPGYASFELAELVGPEGRVLAVDAAERFLAFLRAQKAARERAGQAWPQLEIAQGDACALELPEASFDCVYSRWMLCWVARPEEAFRRAARALAPGGVLALQDYFNYRAMTLAPRSPAFDRLLAGILAKWSATAGDSDVIGHVPDWCEREGLELLELRVAAHASRPGEPLWDWPATFWKSFVPTLVEGGYLTPDDAERFFAEWALRERERRGFFFAPPVFEVLARKRR